VKKLINHTVKDYLKVLSKKEPTPGGGSAAAVTGSLGVSLLIMVAKYSQGRSQSKIIEKKFIKIIKDAEILLAKFQDLVDEDANAYKNVVLAQKKTAQDKRKANKYAQKVVKDICNLCYKSVKLAPYLVENGNLYLIADVEVAVNLLMASFKSADSLAKYNS
jgi:formiminotetrahydrofolate cyclodeaminase